MKTKSKKLADQILNFNPFKIGSLGFRLCEANMRLLGWYACEIDEVKTFIEY